MRWTRGVPAAWVNLPGGDSHAPQPHGARGVWGAKRGSLSSHAGWSKTSLGLGSSVCIPNRQEHKKVPAKSCEQQGDELTPHTAEFTGLSAAPSTGATPGRAGQPRGSGQTWVLQQITPGSCSPPGQRWCGVEKASLWVLVHPCQTSASWCIQHIQPLRSCWPHWVLLAIHCSVPVPSRHTAVSPGTGWAHLSRSISPVQSDKMRCYLLPGRGPVLIPKLLPSALPYTQS